MDYNTSDLVDKIMDGQHTGAKEVFRTMMNDKIISEIGAKKVEMAQDLLPSLDKEQSEVVIDKIRDFQDR